MYIGSAATDTLQGQAMQRINTRWGDDGRQPKGRESLAGPVCKKKYKPFLFRLVRQGLDFSIDASTANARVASDGKVKPQPHKPLPDSSPSTWQVQVERLYGCACHHERRRQVIFKYGERPGWEPFGQWSLKKAMLQAKQEATRLNALAKVTMEEKQQNSGLRNIALDEMAASIVREAKGTRNVLTLSSTPTPNMKLLPLCSNGDCLWKVKTAYDDIAEEIEETNRLESRNAIV
ncbi:hypothetical protein MPSEU_001008600 [Mayamaea pseudoterrestris]|nr:hypothetical protein MPSEU_001008600 [Mayamaea pseudoterrestris]